MAVAILAVLSKVWAWWKRWWKWVLFPIGILSFLFVGRQVVDALFDDEELELPAPDDTLYEIRNVLIERDEKLLELKQEHAEELQRLSTEQRKELTELEAKPLDEVVQWFDKLSSS